jgi:hypothetical protein
MQGDQGAKEKGDTGPDGAVIKMPISIVHSIPIDTRDMAA